VSTAVQALEYGAFHYLTKPVDTDALARAVAKAVSMHRMARVKQQAAELLGHAGALGADRAGLEASFDRAMQTLWMAYHPIVDCRRKTIYGYEALLRSNEPSLPHPGAVLDAATRLGRLDALGRSIRDLSAAPMDNAGNAMLFVNLHVTDLMDPWLSAPEAPLSKIANRVVLEVTERSSLDEVKDVRARVAALREMGFRIAVDDLGAGYAGLTSFTLLEPEIVKLDMSLVRDVHKNSTKQKVIRSMTALSQDMGMTVVAEGVETAEERDTLIDLDCDLLQGFLFARPGKPFPEVKW
jgi:EAL domain-containing protein (putative c-di-GMP-specific phosphodiesterase class I)